MARYVIRATADEGCVVSVDLTGDQYLAVRHVVEGIQAHPNYGPAMSIHTPEDWADTYGDLYGPTVDLGPVPTQPVVQHVNTSDLDYDCPYCEDTTCPACAPPHGADCGCAECDWRG